MVLCQPWEPRGTARQPSCLYGQRREDRLGPPDPGRALCSGNRIVLKTCTRRREGSKAAPTQKLFHFVSISEQPCFNVFALSSASRMEWAEGGSTTRDSQGEGLWQVLLSPSWRGTWCELWPEGCPGVRGTQGHWGGQDKTPPHGTSAGAAELPSTVPSTGKLRAGAGLGIAELKPHLRQSTLQLFNKF